LEVDGEHFGQRLMCPLCRAVVYCSPPRPGEKPAAKYEVQCSHGHILRVKQKYLGKEVTCPSCQETVSMQVDRLLTHTGARLGTAAPDLVAKYKQGLKEQQAKRKKGTNEPAGPAPAPATLGTPSGRLPAPPTAVAPPTTEMSPEELTRPLPPHLASHEFELTAPPPLPPSAPVENFELDIIDTQFRIDMTHPPAAPPRPQLEPGGAGGRIPRPPVAEPREDGTVELKPVEVPPTGAAGGEVHVKCPKGHMLIVAREHLGQKVQCPLCQAVVDTTPAAPAKPATVQFPCPNGHLLEVDREYAGAQVQCPLCQAIATAPEQ